MSQSNGGETGREVNSRRKESVQLKPYEKVPAQQQNRTLKLRLCVPAI